MMHVTIPMPNRYRKAFDEAVREGQDLDSAQERMREMMRAEFPDNGEAVGGCICTETWGIVLVWKAP